MKTTKQLVAYVVKCIIESHNNVEVSWYNYRTQSGDIKLEIDTNHHLLTLSVAFKSTDYKRPIIHDGILTYYDSDFELTGVDIKQIELPEKIINQLSAFVTEGAAVQS